MTIGEFSSVTGLSTYTLRYYESKGIIKVDRDPADRRNYRESDIEWIRFVQRLKDTGMLLRDIQTYSELRYAGDQTMAERLNLLEKHRIFVMEEQKKWEEYRENLDQKIAFYRERVKIS